jgi:hypothetical protein
MGSAPSTENPLPFVEVHHGYFVRMRIAVVVDLAATVRAFGWSVARSASASCVKSPADRSC